MSTLQNNLSFLTILVKLSYRFFSIWNPSFYESNISKGNQTKPNLEIEPYSWPSLLTFVKPNLATLNSSWAKSEQWQGLCWPKEMVWFCLLLHYSAMCTRWGSTHMPDKTLLTIFLLILTIREHTLTHCSLTRVSRSGPEYHTIILSCYRVSQRTLGTPSKKKKPKRVTLSLLPLTHIP